MLFHDVMKKLPDEDLKILASYLEGVKKSTYKNKDGKKIEETRKEFADRFIQVLLVASSGKKEDNCSWEV